MHDQGLVLVLNAGSATLKFALFELTDAIEPVCRGMVDGVGEARARLVLGAAPARELAAGDHDTALAAVLARLREDARLPHVVAAGHRVVHGGTTYAAPVRIDAAVREALGRLVPLAPLHQPHNLAAIDALGRLLPALPQVACFDTAFHRTQPAVAERFALPRSLHDAGVRRYGFHGLSYEYIAEALPAVVGSLPERCIVAHLGSGASLAALERGRSIATTMSFTALDGVPMATRPGALDPGVVLYLIGQRGMSVEEVSELLYHRSGLAGVSGIAGDMRTLLASSAPEAAEAVALFCYRVARAIGSLAAALGGLDALVFTAGIGEHAAPVRARILEQCAWLGVRLDAEANARHGPRLTAPDSTVSAWVIPTDEERMIARHTVRVLGLA